MKSLNCSEKSKAESVRGESVTPVGCPVGVGGHSHLQAWQPVFAVVPNSTDRPIPAQTPVFAFALTPPIFSVQVTWSADSPGTMGIQKQGLLVQLIINVRLPCAPLSWRCRCECYLAHASRSDVTEGSCRWTWLMERVEPAVAKWRGMARRWRWLLIDWNLKREAYSTWLECKIFVKYIYLK